MFSLLTNFCNQALAWIIFSLESTSYVWATAFGRDVGDSKKPLTFSARYLSSWLAFLSLIFINVYVARLMAEIVKQTPTKPFTSLKDPEVKHLFSWTPQKSHLSKLNDFS